VLSGDFISPSVIGTLKYEGKRIRGKQMVDALNTLGLDWVVFGNHEFDYDDMADLQARLDESKFTWFGANARQKGSTWTQQFSKKMADGSSEICPDNKVFSVKDADGTTVNLGIFGVLINSGRKPYVEYTDYMEAGLKNYALLQSKSDLVVALTHLEISDDKKLAAALPGVPLFMGGHDHDNMRHPIGPSVVAKADANAKTVYIHTLRFDKRKKTSTLKSELRQIDATLPEEPATAAVVAKWEKIKNESLSSAGFDASAKVTTLKEPLDCRDAVTRHQQAPVGKMITDAMLAASKNKPVCALVNSGSIRVDDVLTGTLTELDVVRMLPFGGAIAEVEMRGSLLRRTLETSLTNKGNGGFLQFGNIRQDPATKQWMVGNAALSDNALYMVSIGEFLLTGNEANMSFLKTSVDADGKSSNPDVTRVLRPDPKDKNDLRNDVRLALIASLRK
jgi:5'-nucleotidase / UDP-sugar diphosphatase